MEEFGLIPDSDDKVDCDWVNDYLKDARAVMREAMSVVQVTKLVLIELKCWPLEGMHRRLQGILEQKIA